MQLLFQLTAFSNEHFWFSQGQLLQNFVDFRKIREKNHVDNLVCYVQSPSILLLLTHLILWFASWTSSHLSTFLSESMASIQILNLFWGTKDRGAKGTKQGTKCQRGESRGECTFCSVVIRELQKIVKIFHANLYILVLLALFFGEKIFSTHYF